MKKGNKWYKSHSHEVEGRRSKRSIQTHSFVCFDYETGMRKEKNNEGTRDRKRLMFMKLETQSSKEAFVADAYSVYRGRFVRPAAFS